MIYAQKQQQTPTKTAEPATHVEPRTDLQDEALTDTIDALLDEIDDVLEVNAEEFVSSYIQAGGQ